MIYVEMTGRCGNQLFEYAIARRIQMECSPNQEIAFNVHYINEKANEGAFLENSLLHFNTVPIKEVDFDSKSVLIKGSDEQKRSYLRYRKILDKLPGSQVFKWSVQRWMQTYINRKGLYMNRRGVHRLMSSKQENIFIDGTYEHIDWVKDMREILMKEFTPRNPINEKNKELMDWIEKNNVVCVSVRRGDYVGSSMRDICTEQYYRKAFDEMRKINPTAEFLIFSDEIEWAKEHLTFIGNARFEDGTDSIYEKLRLMYSCKHYIMSNSTFCWWAQFLSRNPDKIVVSPSRWMNSKGYVGYIEDDWIKIDV